MARVLAIDFGRKRSGIAVTDDLQIVANPLTTVLSKDLLDFLDDYMQHNEVECIVIGEPKTMQNTPSDATRFIEPFIQRLKKRFPQMPLARMDERFTSRMAFQTMIDSGIGRKARQNKALVDSISASLILQSYLEQQNSIR